MESASTCGIKPGSVFVPSEHGLGLGLVDYAESLLQGRSNPEHVSTFCLPVIAFLIDRLDQLPQLARERLLALADGVIDQAAAALGSPTEAAKLVAVPLLKSAQVLIEAGVLDCVVDAVRILDRQEALNIAAWAQQNREGLWARLPAGTCETALARVHAALRTSDGDLAAHAVDAQAVRETLARIAVPTHARVRALFKQAALIETPEVAQVLFQCWKTISDGDDLPDRASDARAQANLDAFLSLLENTSILGDDRDVKTAVELIDQLILSNPDVARSDPLATYKRCFGVVNHLSVNLKMPREALALAKRIYFKLMCDPRQRNGIYQGALERIWDAAGGSIDIMTAVVDHLGLLARHCGDWAVRLHAKYAALLLEPTTPPAVFESSQRDALKAKGFEFDFVAGVGGFVIRPGSGFMPGEDGEGMVDYAESLLQGSLSRDHVGMFCLPVIDFLMVHFAQLPQEAQQRVLRLAAFAHPKF